MLTQPTNTQQLVRVSGRGTLVNLQIDDDVPVETACEALRGHLAANVDLYARGEVAVDIGRRILSDDQKARIRATVETESGLTVKRFLCDPEILEREHQRIVGLLAEQTTISRQNPTVSELDNDAAEAVEDNETASNGHVPGSVPVGGLAPGGQRFGVPALIVRGTCRAGEIVRSAGNLVILGNVNPGAQVIADGDVLVFGGLRGLAHAGASGDAGAIIIAMTIARPSLRIAGYSWSDDDPPPGARRQSNDGGRATIATVTNGAIHVAPYLRNFAINHGGDPHER